jgi:predicted transcriptional regulator
MTERAVVQVQAAMKTDVIMVDGLITVEEAVKLMKEANANALIVKKRHDHDEYGMLLLSDITKKVLALNRSTKRVNVYEIMAKPVISVRPEMDIRYCARLFENFGLSYAPVIKNDEVIGIVSNSDIALRSLEGLSTSTDFV